MKYENGVNVELGDLVCFDTASAKYVDARVMMLGEDCSHLEVDPGFLRWV